MRRLSLLSLALVAAPAFAQQTVRTVTPARWDDSFGWPGISSPPSSVAQFDDGSGPKLYVGGDFHVAGHRPTNDLACWDGVSWKAVPVPSDTDTAYDGTSALCVFDDGSGPRLFVAGHYTSGSQEIGVLAWDGVSWESFAFAGGLYNSSLASSLFTDGSSLYVGGIFDQIAGVSTVNVARYDASGWHAMGTATAGGLPDMALVRAIATSDALGPTRLFVGTTEPFPVDCCGETLYWWDGSSWIAVPGITDSVSALASYAGTGGTELVVGTSQPLLSLTGAGFASFSPNAPTGVVTLLSRLEAGKPILYAGGSFTTGGGKTLNRIGRWNGTTWQALGGATPGVTGQYQVEYVNDLAFANLGAGERLFVCGDFDFAGPRFALNVASYGAGTWQPLGSGEPVEHQQYLENSEFAIFDDGDGPKVYLAGLFRAAALVPNLARWEGGRWTPVPGNPFSSTDDLETLHVWDDGNGPALYIGGAFNVLGSSGIVRWDGTTWSGLGTGVFGKIYAIEDFVGPGGPELWIGGSFARAGGIPARNLARWSGSAWSAASDTNDYVEDLETWNDGSGPKLFAVGGFTQIGGLSVGNIAAWDGTTWSDLDGGVVNNGIDDHGLQVVDLPGLGGRQLLVFGRVLQAGGASVSGGLARWTGTSWGTDLGFPAQWSTSAACWNDGTGSKLYAAGGLSTPSDYGVWVLESSGWRAIEEDLVNLPPRLFAYERGPLGPSLWISAVDLVFGNTATGGVARLHREGPALNLAPASVLQRSQGDPRLVASQDLVSGEIVLEVLGVAGARSGAVVLGTGVLPPAWGVAPRPMVSGILAVLPLELDPSGRLGLRLRIPDALPLASLHAQALLFVAEGAGDAAAVPISSEILSIDSGAPSR